MSDDKQLTLSIIFTGDFTQLSAAIDLLKAKLAELNASLKTQAKAVEESSKKIDEPAKKLKKSVEDLGKATTGLKKETQELAKTQGQTAEAGRKFGEASAEQAKKLDAQSAALSRAKGNSAEYESALAKVSAQHEVGTVRFNQLKTALDKAERSILQTADSMFRSKKAGDEWAQSIDRTRVMNSFLNGELVKLNGQIISSGKSSQELARIQKDLGAQYDYLGREGKRHIGMLGTQYKSVEDLKTGLKGLREVYLQNNSATEAAQKSIRETASWMNQAGMNGEAWAKKVDTARVAQAFLRDEVIKTNGQLLAKNKTTQQLNASVADLAIKYKDLGNVESFIGSRLGTTIGSFNQMSNALKSASDRMAEKAQTSRTLNREINSLQSSYGKFSAGTEYMINKLKAGNITFDQAVNVMTKYRQQMGQAKELQTFGENLTRLRMQADKLGSSMRGQADQWIGAFEKGNATFAFAKEQIGGLVRQQANLDASNKQVEKGITSLRNQYRQFPEAVEEMTRAVRSKSTTLQEAKANMIMYQDSVNSAAKAQKEATKAAKDLSQGLQTSSATAKSSMGYFDRLGVALKSMAAWLVAAQIISLVTRAFAEGAKTIAEYDQAVANLKSILNATSSEAEMMGKKMVALSNNTQFSIKEVADGMTLIGQAGQGVTDVMNMITPVTQLATGTMEKMALAADLVTTAVTNFQLGSRQSARVADVMAVAVNQSKTTLEKLAVAFNYIGPLAKDAGLTLEETAAAIMKVQDAGIRASTTGTGFRQVLAKMLEPTSKMRAIAGNLGVDVAKLSPLFKDSSGKAQGFGAALDQLQKLINGDVGRALQLFELRGAGVAFVLAQMGGKGLDDLVDKVSMAGMAAKMAETQMGGLTYTLKNLWNNVANLGISLSKGGLVDMFKLLAGTVGHVFKLLSSFQDSMAGNFLLTMAAATGAVWLLTKAFMALIGVRVVEAITAITNSMKGMVAVQVGASLAGMATGAAATAKTLWILDGAVVATTASSGTLARIFATLQVLWGRFVLLLANLSIYARVALAIGAIAASVYSWSNHQKKLNQQMEENYKIHSSNAEILDGFLKQVDKGNLTNKMWEAELRRVADVFPQLSSGILDTTKSLQSRTEIVKKLYTEEKKLSDTNFAGFVQSQLTTLKEIPIEMEALSGRIKASTGDYMAYLKYIATNTVDYMKFAFRAIGSTLTMGLIDDNVKYANSRMKELNFNLLKTGQDMKETARKLATEGTSMEATMRKVYGKDYELKISKADIEKIRALDTEAKLFTDSMKKMNLTFSQMSAIAQMPEEWKEAYENAAPLVKGIIVREAQSAKKELDKLWAEASSGKITNEDALEKERVIIDKHYQVIVGKTKQFYETLQKLLEDRYKSEERVREIMLETNKAYLDRWLKQNIATATLTIQNEKQRQDAIEALERTHQAYVLASTDRYLQESLAAIRKKQEEEMKIVDKTIPLEKDRVAKRLDITKKSVEQEIQAWKKATDVYKQEMDARVSKMQYWANEYQKALDKIAQLEQGKTGKGVDLQGKIREEQRKKMTPEDQQKDIQKQITDYTLAAEEFRQKGREAIDEKTAEAMYRQADSFYSKIEGLIDKSTIYQRNANGELVADESRSADQRILLYKGLSERVLAMEQEKIDRQKALAEQAKAQYEQEAAGAQDLATRMEQASQKIKELSKIQLDVDMESLNTALTELENRLGGANLKAKIKFLGEASPEAPLMETMDNIVGKINEMNTLLSSTQWTLKISFTAQTGSTETTVSPIDVIKAITTEVTNFKTMMDGMATNPPKLKIDIDEAKTNLQTIMGMLTEIAVAWVVKVVIAIEGLDALKEVKALHDGLDGVVTKSTHKLTTEKQETTAAEETSKDIQRGFAEGGPVPGKGTGDTVPGWLTPGEFVVRRAAVAHYGVSFLKGINSMMARAIPRFKEGGVVPNIKTGPHDTGEVFTVKLESGNASIPIRALGNANDMRAMVKGFQKEMKKMRLSHA